MSSPSIQNQAQALVQQPVQGLQPAPQQGKDNSVYNGPDYKSFRRLIDNANILDGNVIVKNGMAVKVDFGGWGSKHFNKKEMATHVATPEESRTARESLYMAIKGKLELDNGGILDVNAKNKLLVVAEELGVTLDSKFNRIEGETISDDLSRMEERYIFDYVEDKAVLKDGAESSLGVIKDLGIKLTTEQFEKLFNRAANRIIEKLSPQLAKGELPNQIRASVKEYVLAYKGKLPKGTTQTRKNELAEEIKQFFKYESGDIFGGGRQRVALDLNSLAERLAAKFKLEKTNDNGAVSYQMVANDAEAGEEDVDVIVPGEKPTIQGGQMEKILPKPPEKVAENHQQKVPGAVSFANDAAKNGLSTLFQKITRECYNEHGELDTEKVLDALSDPNSKDAFDKLCRAVRELGENPSSLALHLQPLAEIAGEEFAAGVQDLITEYNKGNGGLTLKQAAQNVGFSGACNGVAGTIRQIAINNLLADVIFDKDVYQFKAGQEANRNPDATPRIVEAFKRNYSSFMELCKAAGGVKWENRNEVDIAFERLENVAGADFASSLQDTLRRFVKEIGGVDKISATGLSEEQQRVLSTLVRRDKLEEKIDEGLAYVIRDNGGMAKVIETLQEQCGVDASKNCNANELFLRDAIGVCIRKMDAFQARKMFSARLRGKANLDESGDRTKGSIGVSMLKGAGPALIKMLQGCNIPDNATEEVSATLLSVTNKMPTMSADELKEQMDRVFNTLKGSDPTLKQIEVLDSELGSASIAQTLRCRLVYEDGKKAEDVVIKLIKGEALAEFEREKENIKAEFDSNSANVGSGSKEVFYSFVKSIDPEFDLLSEQVNALNGLLIYGDKPGEEDVYEFQLAGGELVHTVKTKKSVSSVNLLLKDGVTMEQVKDMVAECVKESGGDPVKLQNGMRDIAKAVCRFSSKDCIIEKVASGQPVDRILERTGNEVQAFVRHNGQGGSVDSEKVVALEQKLVDLKRTLLEVSKSFSDGVFTTKKNPVVAFHGDFNGGNLIYNETTKQMTIIDYGKGAVLTESEANAIQKMFGILSRNPTKGNEDEILKAYAEVLEAEKKRILASDTKENIANDPFKKTELEQIDRTLALINQTDKSDASKAEYTKLLLSLNSILHTPDSSSDALKKIANPGVFIDNQFIDGFYAALQSHNLATPVAFFDFFGTIGKLDKSITLIDNQLKELDALLETNGQTDANSVQSGITNSLNALFAKENTKYQLLPSDLDVNLTENTIQPEVTWKTIAGNNTGIYDPYGGNPKKGIFKSYNPTISFDIAEKTVTLSSGVVLEDNEYSGQEDETSPKKLSFGDKLLGRFDALANQMKPYQEQKTVPQEQEAVRLKEDLKSLREEVADEKNGIRGAIVDKKEGESVLHDDYKNKVMTAIEKWLTEEWSGNQDGARLLFNSMLLEKFGNDKKGYEDYLGKYGLLGRQDKSKDGGRYVLEVSVSNQISAAYDDWLKRVSNFDSREATHITALATLIYEKNESQIITRLNEQIQALDNLDAALGDAIVKLELTGNNDLLKGVNDPSRSLVSTKFVTGEDVIIAKQLLGTDNYAKHPDLANKAKEWYDGLDGGVKKIAEGEHDVEMEGHKARLKELDQKLEKADADVKAFENYARSKGVNKLEVEDDFRVFNGLVSKGGDDEYEKADAKGYHALMGMLEKVPNDPNDQDLKALRELRKHYDKLVDKRTEIEAEIKKERAKYRSDETLELHLKAFAVKKRMDDNLLNKLNSQVGVMSWVLNKGVDEELSGSVNGIEGLKLPQGASDEEKEAYDTLGRLVGGICTKFDGQNDKMMNVLESKASLDGTEGVKFNPGDKEKIRAGLDKWFGSFVKGVTVESAMPSRGEIAELKKFSQTSGFVANQKTNPVGAQKVIISQIADIENGILVKCKSKLGEKNPIFAKAEFKEALRNSAKEIWKRHFIGVSIANALDKNDAENSLGENLFVDAITALKDNKGDIVLEDKSSIREVLLPHLDAFDHDKGQ